jgi:SAM-dependent methyltransferase
VSGTAFYKELVAAASRRYEPDDRYARYFARGKLGGDPVFRHLLEQGLFPANGSILDLGCGQGVLEALLLAAREAALRNEWPQAWPRPPEPRAMRGIDLVERDVKRARIAAEGHGQFITGDIRDSDFGRADAVVLLDVIHYVDFAEQEVVLQRVRHALHEGGVLLLRVAELSGGWRYRYTAAIDRLAMALRGHRLPRLWNRPLPDWLRHLEALGFSVEVRPMSAGTWFSNVLLVARYHPR